MIRISQMQKHASKRGDNAFASVMEGADYVSRGNARDDMEASIRNHDVAVTNAMTSLEGMDQFGDNGIGSRVPISTNQGPESVSDSRQTGSSNNSALSWTRRLSSGLSMVGTMLGSRQSQTSDIETNHTGETHSSSQYEPRSRNPESNMSTFGSMYRQFDGADSSQGNVRRGDSTIRSVNTRSSMNSSSMPLFDIPVPRLPHESERAELNRLAVAIACFFLSILCTVFFGRGQLGLFLSCYMYNTRMVINQSDTGSMC